MSQILRLKQIVLHLQEREKDTENNYKLLTYSYLNGNNWEKLESIFQFFPKVDIEIIFCFFGFRWSFLEPGISKIFQSQIQHGRQRNPG